MEPREANYTEMLLALTGQGERVEYDVSKLQC
jgi:hypothetical protein